LQDILLDTLEDKLLRFAIFNFRKIKETNNLEILN